MRVTSRHLGLDHGLGQAAPTGDTGLTCNLAGGVWDSSAGVCNLAITPAQELYPGLPVGLQPSGTVEGNPAGLTTETMPVAGSPGQTQTVDPYQVLAQNQASQLSCQASGGTWDPSTGVCTPKNNTQTYILIGAVVLGAFLLMMAVKR